MLSGPQRKFVEGIVAGLDQTAAYRAAYPNCSPKAAESKSSRLVRNGKIEAEIERSKRRAEEEFTKTRVEWLDAMWRVAKKAETAEDFGAAISGYREVGKAQPKWYAPEEVTVAGKVTVIIGAAKE